MRNNEIFETVTNDILAALEGGQVPWIQPWENTGTITAINITTRKAYRGINTLILCAAQIRGRFQHSRWLTFNQCRDNGGMVRKGEKGTKVIFWKFLEKDDKVSGKKETIPLCRTYTVFNVAQCDGLPEDFTATKEIPPIVGENETIEGFIRDTRAEITHGGDRACYSPSLDTIMMPEKGQFENMGAYYATIFHELTHWTGSDKRCKRMLGERFGKEAYAVEELVAEIGSAYLCSHFGVEGKLQHTAYIQSWIKVLKNDKHAIFKASSLAQEAVDCLLSKGSANKAVSSEEEDAEAA